MRIILPVCDIGNWPCNKILNVDIIRLHLACDILDLDARDSLWYLATTALGEEAVNSNK